MQKGYLDPQGFASFDKTGLEKVMQWSAVQCSALGWKGTTKLIKIIHWTWSAVQRDDKQTKLIRRLATE